MRVRAAPWLAILLLSLPHMSGCSLFSSAVACDAQTPCPDALTCGADGFCGDGTEAPDAGPTDDAGTPDDAGPDNDAGPDHDAGPDEDAGPTVDAGPALSTATTIARDLTTVHEGETVTVTAVVRTPNAAGSPVSAGELTLERSSDGGAWAVLTSGAVDASGEVSVGYTAGSENEVAFRARYLGTALYEASVSAQSEPTAVLHLVTHTDTWTSTWSRTFFGSGNPRTDPEFMSFCIQGQFSGTNGNQKCAFGFDDDEIRTTLADATVSAVELFLFWDHWSNGTDGTARIGSHATSEPPATWQDLIDVSVGRWLEPFDVDEGRWLTLPLAVGAELRDGSVRGFVLGPGPDTDLAWYGYASGATQGSPPRLRVTYQRWQ